MLDGKNMRKQIFMQNALKMLRSGMTEEEIGAYFEKITIETAIEKKSKILEKAKKVKGRNKYSKMAQSCANGENCVAPLVEQLDKEVTAKLLDSSLWPKPKKNPNK